MASAMSVGMRASLIGQARAQALMLKRWLTDVPRRGQDGQAAAGDHDLAHWTATDFAMPKPEAPLLLPSALENA